VRIAVVHARGDFGKLGVRECLPLEAITSGLVKTDLTKKTACHVCRRCISMNFYSFQSFLFTTLRTKHHGQLKNWFGLRVNRARVRVIWQLLPFAGYEHIGLKKQYGKIVTNVLSHHGVFFSVPATASKLLSMRIPGGT
jgi:hypothetical protein